MKPIFVLDECMTMKKHYATGNFVKSTDVIGPGASDEEVFELAKKLKVPVITKDKLFVLNMIIQNYPVVYIRGARAFYIESKVVEDPKYSDPITYHLLTTDNIIIP